MTLVIQDYFSERMSGLRADLRVLQKLLSEEIPELAEHLDLQGQSWVTKWLLYGC